jgi:hypothetical protein
MPRRWRRVTPTPGSWHPAPSRRSGIPGARGVGLCWSFRQVGLAPGSLDHYFTRGPAPDAFCDGRANSVDTYQPTL